METVNREREKNIIKIRDDFFAIAVGCNHSVLRVSEMDVQLLET